MKPPNNLARAKIRKAAALGHFFIVFIGYTLLQQRLEASNQGSENVFSGHRALRTSHQMNQRRDIRAGSDGRRVL